MTSTLPPLNALRAFEVAAGHLRFKLAAHELHVTPAAVGLQLLQLRVHGSFDLRRLALVEFRCAHAEIDSDVLVRN